MLYRHEGLVQTQALYSIEAPWLPKSESGTRSPSPHLRHRGNAFSTKSPPSFILEVYRLLSNCQARLSENVSRGGASATASASPQQGYNHALPIIPQLSHSVSRFVKKSSSFSGKVSSLVITRKVLIWNSRSTGKICCVKFRNPGNIFLALWAFIYLLLKTETLVRGKCPSHTCRCECKQVVFPSAGTLILPDSMKLSEIF